MFADWVSTPEDRPFLSVCLLLVSIRDLGVVCFFLPSEQSSQNILVGCLTQRLAGRLFAAQSENFCSIRGLLLCGCAWLNKRVQRCCFRCGVCCFSMCARECLSRCAGGTVPGEESVYGTGFGVGDGVCVVPQPMAIVARGRATLQV